MVMDSTVGTEVAKRATSTIPIVMALVLDPVGSKLIDSLAKPGGNITGLSMMTTVDLNSKRLQFTQGSHPEPQPCSGHVESGPCASRQAGRRPQGARRAPYDRPEV